VLLPRLSQIVGESQCGKFCLEGGNAQAYEQEQLKRVEEKSQNNAIEAESKPSLYELGIENSSHQSKSLNIYKAKITRINPPLNAVFVDYGGDSQGFLPMNEIADEYFPKGVKNNLSPQNVKEFLKEG
jgi:Ribonuclease G/E|tara:strand:- start:450 stop:833 length:384 start_codon:yes stop_codon:yes gene_type:complete